ncbi:MAG: hypothetical protein WBA74_12335 [Cyclobacteriaceae bacterium]
MENFLYSLSIIILVSCTTNSVKEQAAEQEKPEEVAIEQTPNKDSNETETTEAPIELEFATYFYEDNVDKSSQTLDIHRISDDSINYRLYYESQLCTYEQEGLAISRYPGMDGESDEGEDGTMYISTEYEVTEEGQLFSIRIESPEPNRAKINYIYGQPRDECDPDNFFIMRKTTTNKR